jgi:hypothetical protein
MIDKVIKKLNKKHLLIIGGNKIKRQQLIDTIINRANLEFFRLPKGMISIDEYIDAVRKEELYQPWYTKKGKFGCNQILDFHRDWISENNSLVTLEEFQKMEQRWKMEIIRTYLEEIQNRKKGKKTIRLIISQENENGLIDKLAEEIHIKDNERRTKKQIIEGSLEIIEIN